MHAYMSTLLCVQSMRNQYGGESGWCIPSHPQMRYFTRLILSSQSKTCATHGTGMLQHWKSFACMICLVLIIEIGVARIGCFNLPGGSRSTLVASFHKSGSGQEDEILSRVVRQSVRNFSKLNHS